MAEATNPFGLGGESGLFGGDMFDWHDFLIIIFSD